MLIKLKGKTMEEFKLYHSRNIFYPKITLITSVSFNEEENSNALGEIFLMPFDRQYNTNMKIYRRYNYNNNTISHINTFESDLNKFFFDDLLYYSKEILEQEIVYTNHHDNKLYDTYLQTIIIFNEGRKLDLLKFWFDDNHVSLIGWIEDNTKNRELISFVNKIKNISQRKLTW